MSSKSNRPASLIVFALLLSGLCTTAAAKTIYVDDDATGANNGTSWTDAYTFLQNALADAELAEKPVEIRVAQGTYNMPSPMRNWPRSRWKSESHKAPIIQNKVCWPCPNSAGEQLHSS
ncbi:MAG: hypothetical protein ACYS7Y_35880, partial [Planctomycetota bacterium]